jgi:hypothetical protein
MQKIWDQSISEDLKRTSERVQGNIDRIKETASAMMYRKQFMTQEQFSQVDILRSVENLRMRSTVQGASAMDDGLEPGTVMECYHIGFPENTQFFPRDDILEVIRTELNHGPETRRHQSMVLWGIGGVGKTQLALAYSYERKKQGLKAIFWLNSETKDTLLQACTEICVQLKLKGAVQAGQHERNQALLAKWLRETGKGFPYSLARQRDPLTNHRSCRLLDGIRQRGRHCRHQGHLG